MEKATTSGIHKDCRLGNDKNTSKITLTAWINFIRVYLKEIGMDTVFHIYNPVENTEIYILKYRGSAEPYRVSSWETLLLYRVNGKEV